jgi:hypothetical protein
MNEPTFTPQDYIKAHDIVRHLAENMAIEFQINGANFSRDEMQKHVNERSALIHTANLLLDAGERLVK